MGMEDPGYGSGGREDSASRQFRRGMAYAFRLQEERRRRVLLIVGTIVLIVLAALFGLVVYLLLAR